MRVSLTGIPKLEDAYSMRVESEETDLLLYLMDNVMVDVVHEPVPLCR
jgi:hypothetical protein